MIIALVIVLLLALLVLRVPVGFALAISGTIGLYLWAGAEAVSGILQTTPYTTAGSESLLAVPLFILMAQFILVSGAAEDLFNTARIWVGRTPAGLGVATTLAGVLFAALSGSSTASAATLSGTAIPQMTKQGYDTKLSTGLVAVVGTIAMMIPPSIAFILYGVLAEESVGKLLIAGIIPGCLIALAVVVTLLIRVLRKPSLAPATRAYPFSQKMRALGGAGAFVILFLLVTVTLYLGIATATEAAALGAFGSFVIALFRKSLSFKITFKALVETVSVTAMIMMIVVGAHVFGYFLAFTQVTSTLVEWIGGLTLAPILILLAILLMYLILGFFMDQVAILALTVPLTAPIVSDLGYDLIWFGVLVVLMAEVGMVTPPFGLNAFVVARTARMPVEKVFAGIWPYLLGILGVVILLVAVPELVLWLPGTTE